ncbi:DUF4347 domain-containing protein, partial [Photobacterium iliopiscarium]
MKKSIYFLFIIQLILGYFLFKNNNNQLPVKMVIIDQELISNDFFSKHSLQYSKIKDISDFIFQLEQQPQSKIVDLWAHGTAGKIKFGRDIITLENIEKYKSEIIKIGSLLGSDGVINFLGCDLAKDEKGEKLLSKFSQLSKISVRASIDKTGHSNHGGDWDLEMAFGHQKTVFTPLSWYFDYSAILADTDGDGVDDAIDIDDDNDGILDTDEIVCEVDVPLDLSGITAGSPDESNMPLSTTIFDGGLTPVNTDGMDEPDFRDLNSDNEGGNDTTEAGLTLLGSVGVNGLHSNLESADDYLDVNGIFDNTQTDNFLDSDNDVIGYGDVEFRDVVASCDVSGLAGATSKTATEFVTINGTPLRIDHIASGGNGVGYNGGRQSYQYTSYSCGGTFPFMHVNDGSSGEYCNYKDYLISNVTGSGATADPYIIWSSRYWDRNGNNLFDNSDIRIVTKITYINGDEFFDQQYCIDSADGSNNSSIGLSQGFDTYLNGGDAGAAFAIPYNSANYQPDTGPYSLVGVTKNYTATDQFMGYMELDKSWDRYFSGP